MTKRASAGAGTCFSASGCPFRIGGDKATHGTPPDVHEVECLGAGLDRRALAHMVTEVDGIIGVKQSAEDLKLVTDLLVNIGDKGVVFSATDALMYPSFALGVHGAISAILTAVPEMLVQSWNADQNEDHNTARDLHMKLLGIWNAISGQGMVGRERPRLRCSFRSARAAFRGLHGVPHRGRGKAHIQKALADAGVIS